MTWEETKVFMCFGVLFVVFCIIGAECKTPTTSKTLSEADQIYGEWLTKTEYERRMREGDVDERGSSCFGDTATPAPAKKVVHKDDDLPMLMP